MVDPSPSVCGTPHAAHVRLATWRRGFDQQPIGRFTTLRVVFWMVRRCLGSACRSAARAARCRRQRSDRYSGVRFARDVATAHQSRESRQPLVCGLSVAPANCSKLSAPERMGRADQFVFFGEALIGDIPGHTLGPQTPRAERPQVKRRSALGVNSRRVVVNCSLAAAMWSAKTVIDCREPVSRGQAPRSSAMSGPGVFFLVDGRGRAGV
jgi:hypothetical protein